LRDRWTLGFRHLPQKTASSSALLRRRPAYGEEKIFEAYYSYKLNRWSALTFHYQFIADPAYNADRGPVHIFSGRLHGEF